MHNATQNLAGEMAAIIGLPAREVEEICRQASSAGIVQAVNYNSPVQTVISGEQAGLDQAIEIAQSRCAKRARMLPVSAPFHSRLMDPVAEKIRPLPEEVTINDAALPVTANITAQPETGADEIRKNLIAQINGPVHWTNSIEYMISRGINTFVELGPGQVLSGMIRKINSEANCFPVESPESIDALVEKLRQ